MKNILSDFKVVSVSGLDLIIINTYLMFILYKKDLSVS